MAVTPAQADTGDLAAYLRARAAAADGANATAVYDYGRALAGAPDNPVVAIRAYRAALDAGDMTLARRAGAALAKAGVAPADVALLTLADAARANDPGAAARAVATLGDGPLAILRPALNGWIAFARGADWAPILDAATDPLAKRFATENRALLLIAAGRTDDGVAAIRAIDSAQAPVDIRLAAAQLLRGTDKAEAAQAVLSGDGPAVTAFRREAGVKPSLAFGVSRLMTRVAVDLTGGDKPSPLVIAFTRAALVADPSYDRPRLILADALSRGGNAAGALAVLGEIGPDRPLADLAAATRVSILAGAGRDAEATTIAKGRAEATDAGADDWQRYADLLYAADRFDEAATWYRRAVDARPADWAAWMQYGGALDRAGRWPESRAALEKAVALGPDQPLALNYLGYARMGRGEDVAAAQRMLERAAALDPRNSSVVDSLGWAYHLTGRSGQALPLLERAAADQPDNAEINEHLGDVYWTLGRRYEARYAWRAAALGAEGDEVGRLQAKIASGLPRRR